MSLIWNGNHGSPGLRPMSDPKKPSAMSSRKVIYMPRRRTSWKEIAATAIMILAALYFLGHIIAACARGSFGGWR